MVNFLKEQVRDAKEKDVLFSLHMKATMMKVSDPIIFGHAVKIYFQDLIETYGETFEALGVDFNNGFGDLINNLKKLPEDKKMQIEDAIETVFENGPAEFA